MKKSTGIWIIIILAVIIIGLVIWVLSSSSGNVPSTVQPVVTEQTAPVTTITTTTTSTTTQSDVLTLATNAKLGTYLVAANGMTLYMDAKDSMNVSSCTGSCATAWPPYTVSATAPLVGGAGVTGAITTITRADGTLQVTYNGMPLYFWQGDKKVGDTTGQNINSFSVMKP